MAMIPGGYQEKDRVRKCKHFWTTMFRLLTMPSFIFHEIGRKVVENGRFPRLVRSKEARAGPCEGGGNQSFQKLTQQVSTVPKAQLNPAR